ncbi:NAD-dependent epimerase/dehydratase family protein [Candidatus Pelagibacter sp.]|nr:NAD-dependent epimerase/dehydratase family protein [Candidatus Pelagibacter sp.]
MSKILITGGAGFIGFHLARKYLDLGYEVYLIDNLSRGKIDKSLNRLLKNKNFFFLNQDICKSEIKLKKNFKFIFHCAAIIGVRHVLKKPYDVLTMNHKMLENAIKYAKKQKNLNRFVFFSTSEVYAETLKKKLIKFPTSENSKILIDENYGVRSTYMLSKLYGEYLTLFSKLPATIFRPHNFYGPRMGMSHVIPELTGKILSKKNVKIYSHNHTRTFYFIDDAIDEIYNVLKSSKSKNEVYNIGSQEEVKVFNLAKKIASIVNKKNITFKKMKNIHNSPTKRLPSLKKIKKISNFKFKHNLESGLRKTIDWYIKNYFTKKKLKKII